MIVLNKPLPFKGLNIRIPNIIPIRGRGFINQASTLLIVQDQASGKGQDMETSSEGLGVQVYGMGKEVATTIEALEVVGWGLHVDFLTCGFPDILNNAAP